MEQQRQQKQQTLLESAASHGPYLWSSNDIKNALLWFRVGAASVDSVTAASAEFAVGAQEDASPAIGVESIGTPEQYGGCEFLRRLLHSSGIHVPRVTKKSGRKRSRHRNEGKSGDANAVAGKKRKRGAIDITPPNPVAKVDDVLSTVLKGYYRMFLTRNGVLSKDRSLQNAMSGNQCNGTIDSRNPTEHQNSIDATTVGLATSRLQQDLNSIILSRLRTKKLYQLALGYLNSHTKPNIKQAPKGLQMNLLIDQYMTHPTTSILRAYTSTLYDRYTSLVEDPKDRFLRKLLGLSNANWKIMQVVLLFLLEPLRRLYVHKMEAVQSTSQMPNINSSSSEDVSSRNKQASNFAMFPLLTSSATWSDISSEDVEKECCNQQMLQIVEFILHSASTEHSILESDKEVSWWSLPSPLWCFVGQLYFPLACAYIRHWINAAVLAHDKLYDLDFSGKHKCRPQSKHLDSSIEKFESTMIRIRHFSQTSQRLDCLTFHMLSVIEEESGASFMNESTVNAGNASFRQKVVWNVIKRGLES